MTMIIIARQFSHYRAIMMMACEGYWHLYSDFIYS